MHIVGQPRSRIALSIADAAPAPTSWLRRGRSSSIGHLSSDLSVAVLRSVADAKAAYRDIVPVWTMPGNEATVGHLTNRFHDVVTTARSSVTCATYNFSSTSKMWDALKTASEEPDVAACIYVDAEKGDPPV